jgi:hypothetical protein
MKKLHFFLLLFFYGSVTFSSLAQSATTDLKNGDLIFIVNPNGQGKAIQLATHSKYTHIGIVFIENGKPYVYHAIEPVSKNTLSEFVSMSADGNYEIKRLNNQSVLTTATVERMRQWAIQQLGKHYDVAFNWGDSELYCSEFVWKVYHQIAHIDIGNTRPLKEFDLSHQAVKQKLKQRYGSKIPLQEPMISPGDMYMSDLLK